MVVKWQVLADILHAAVSGRENGDDNTYATIGTYFIKI